MDVAEPPAAAEAPSPADGDDGGPSTAGWITLLLRVAILMAALPAMGLLLVVVADLVPSKPIVDHLVEDQSSGRLTAEQYRQSPYGNQIDEFTECIGTTVGLGNPIGTNPLESAIRSPTLGNCETTTENISTYLAGDGLEREYDYYRYWHGYAVISRPLLAVVGLAGTRLVVTMALLGVMAGIARSVGRRHGAVTAAVLFLPFVLTTDFIDLGTEFTHAIGALAVLGSSWFAFEYAARGTSISRIATASMIAGALVVFADFLTMPPGGWALCTALIGLAAAGTHGGRALSARLGVATVFWVFGYGWMWLSKWVLAGLVVGFGTVRDNISSQVQLRVDGEQIAVEQRWFASIQRNVETWWAMPLSKFVLVALVVTCGVVLWRRLTGSGVSVVDMRWPDRALLAAPAALPLLWYEILRNHSQVHYWFTYRSVAIALGILAAAVVARIGPNLPMAPAHQRSATHPRTGDAGDRSDHPAGWRRSSISSARTTA